MIRLLHLLFRKAPTGVTVVVVAAMVVLFGYVTLTGHRWAGQDVEIERALDAKYAVAIGYERIATGRWSRHRREFVFVDGQRRRDCQVRGEDDPVLTCRRNPQPTLAE